MADQTWITQRDHGCGIIELVLDHAPVNALEAARLMGFRDVMNDLSANEDVRAIVLSSPLKVFSAGLNLKQAQHFDLDDQRAIVDGLNQGFMALFASPKPVICAVNGHAIAGGLFYVLASDHRIAVPRAQFGLAEVRVGVGFPAGPLGIARAMLDANLTRRMMLRGQPIDAHAALAAGLVDDIVEPDMLMQAALDAAREFAQLPPAAYAAVKSQLRADIIAKIAAAVEAETAADLPWYTDETADAMARMIG
ncbi:enoyl-CoA hydratase/isomerase family protein [Pseudosulfitobacter koreensis]|uniref:Enoyl-CoA hydratase/isomerase family protein n=1 Tax=Pseudosulfitobacter koreensis TaxID=2968472 RepID=A0ABT1Z083_9RHOB|nr:enoyl-CoA hydratase/isomerase family protein [Pseudosulfitobacter koreense]MCR8826550.1 enoyl-CoA hydratase/isomerase family protein [Pseudosulfitobacter koreense]